MSIRAALILVFFIIVSCSRSPQSRTVRISFSQAMTTDDWRQQMNKSMQIEASLHPEVELNIFDAGNSVAKQIKDIERLIAARPDVIIVSPIQTKPVTGVVQKAIDSGIPVLIIDRKTEGETYTSYLGADNIEVGRNAANYIVTNGIENRQIIEITGLKGSSPADERSLGFEQVLKDHPSFSLVGRVHGDWEKHSVGTPLKKMMEEHPNVDYIFAHNDRMAFAAWETARNLGKEKRVKIIGVDGLNTVNGGLQHIKDGKLEATILYPTGGNEAIKLAVRMFRKEQVAKNNILNTIVIDKKNVEIIENQMDKIDQQQSVIDSQQGAIKIQAEEYASQNNLLRLLAILLVLILGLAGYSVFSTVFISRKKRELEKINQTVVSQKDEILKMSEIAQQSTDAKINFFTGLSHEFKTPITLIMSYAESLIENDKIKGTRLTDEVRLIHNNSERLLRLINQLLDFRKIEAQKFNLRASRVNLYDFSAEIMKNFRGEAVRRNITFELSAQNKETELFLDRSLMDKVYYNLISNAFKFTPDNGSIEISIRETSKEVKISFKDSGIGIPEKELSDVFNPFFRASNNTKNSSGIGLNLSKEFIQLHKGNIDVRSKQGAEFVITLLKGKEHLDIGEILESEQSAAISQDIFPEQIPKTISTIVSAESQERHSLLIIEDHIDLSSFLSTKLEDAYEIYLSDGSNAIEQAVELVPDIIICDVNLNGTDGFGIANTLKKDLRTSHIPIIMLTALSNKESMIKGFQAGVDQYLTKPFSLAVLRQSLTNLLYNRERLRYYYTNNIYRVDPDTRFGLVEQDFVTRMNEIISRNMASDKSKFSVEDLAEALNISRVQLYRKVKAILGISISDHINNIRLERAVEMLKSNDMTVSEIAYALGFSSPNYFSVAFKNKFGVSPKEYKK